ncbi:MAG: hypothetical protein C0505_12340 [Leptothrix sp. (in: Bacteria)]|nr:hypothetical protein [Leptothrix sp. (in: b-proteobacteria)]
MNSRRSLKIAQRISALLQRELGQGVDAKRMLAEPMYARDVLLVCEALPGSELAELAARFRAALANAADAAAGGARGAGFSASRFINSLFAATTGSPASTLDAPPEARRRGWFGRSRVGDKRSR